MAIFSELGLDELTKRRQDQLLTLMFKMIVSVGPEDFILESADLWTRAPHSLKLSSTTDLLYSFINKTTPE